MPQSRQEKAKMIGVKTNNAKKALNQDRVSIPISQRVMSIKNMKHFSNHKKSYFDKNKKPIDVDSPKFNVDGKDSKKIQYFKVKVVQ